MLKFLDIWKTKKPKVIVLNIDNSRSAKIHPYLPKENVLIVGSTRQGRARHPWDNLKVCKCGYYPFMEGKDSQVFEVGGHFRVGCPECGIYTKYGDVSEVKYEWTNEIMLETVL